MRTVLVLDQSTAPVESAPSTGRTVLDIIRPALLMTEGTIILMPPVGACMDPEVVHAIGILIRIVSSHNCGLDTEQLLALCIS